MKKPQVKSSIMFVITRLFLATLTILLVMNVGRNVIAQEHELPSQDVLDSSFAGGFSLESEMKLAYTPEEIQALERALAANNMNLHDMDFKKDYTKGYLALPIILDMMAHPLHIAPYMDGFVKSIDALKGNKVFAVPDMLAGAMLIPQIKTGDIPDRKSIDEARASVRMSAKPPYSDMRPAPPEPFLVILDSFALADKHIKKAFENLTEEEMHTLRLKIPFISSWHDVFKSPYDDGETKAIEEKTKKKPEDYFYKMAEKIDYTELFMAYAMLPTPDMFTDKNMQPFFPLDKPLQYETPWGVMVIGTPKDDIYTGDIAILIEPGGNDTYLDCRIGAAYGTENNNIGFFLDMGGNDKYYCWDTNITQGAALLGVASFYDMGNGNDMYLGGHFVQGASSCGFGSFYDAGGNDNYSAKSYTQGASTFGVAAWVDGAPEPKPVEGSPANRENEEVDESDLQNDHVEAWTMSQGLSRMMSVAICHGSRGNDTYHAGGVYLHAPLFNDRYQSFSQGFAIGARDVDYAGGIAFMLDDAGNDYYLGDIYNQGVGYWFSGGFIYDRTGNDHYEMTQYGQGSGIHLAVGGIIDNEGNDSYVMNSGLGQGGSHDYAASVQMDRAGNDRYMGSTSCNGTGLTNSVGLFFDRSGDDLYGGSPENSTQGAGRWDRDTGSIGVFVDTDGKDSYSGKAHDNRLWTQMTFGAGIDFKKEAIQKAEETPKPEKEVMPPNIDIPKVCSYEGEMTDAVFDELWEIAVRWEVGDNRWIVPKARERLIAFGKVVIPKIDENFNDTLGLAYRSYEVILPELYKQYPNEVKDMLVNNLKNDDIARKRNALSLIGVIKITDLVEQILPLLDNKETRRQTISVLSQLGSKAGNEKIRTFLNPKEYENLIEQSSRALLTLGETDLYPQFRILLDHEYMVVREYLIALIASNFEMFKGDITRDLIGEQINPRTRVSLLRVLTKVPEFFPSTSLYESVNKCLDSDDWVLRAHGVRVFQNWLTFKNEEWARTQEMIKKRLEELKAKEQDFHVRFVLEDV